MKPITTILVPTDFSESSGEALDCARGLAAALGASLRLMHVVETLPAFGLHSEVFGVLPAGYVETLDKSARLRLEASLTPEETRAFHAEFITRVGTPAREILDYLAAHAEVGLVVMATAGRGGVARVVVGSVADKIVRGAPCPVTTIHPQHAPGSRDGTVAA